MITQGSYGRKGQEALREKKLLIEMKGQEEQENVSQPTEVSTGPGISGGYP